MVCAPVRRDNPRALARGGEGVVDGGGGGGGGQVVRRCWVNFQCWGVLQL